MIYVTQHQQAAASTNTVTLLDKSSEANPYDEFAENDARGIKIRYDKEAKIAFIDDIEQIYSDITLRGIRKDPRDFTVIHHGQRPLAPWFEEYVKNLPFTGKLEIFPEPQKPEPPMPTIQKNQEREPQKPQEPTDYASLVQKAKAAKEAAIDARNNWENINRIEYLEGVAKEAERIVEERRIAKEKTDKEREDGIKINEYLSKPGVKDALRRFSDKFNQEAGRKFIYGITPDGLVVAVRDGCSENDSGNDYFKAWVLDVKLSPDEIEKNIISTSFNSVNVMALHGSYASSYFFPYSLRATPLSDEEIEHGVFPATNTELIQFAKKTGGFMVSQPDRQAVIGGGRTLYPLDLA